MPINRFLDTACSVLPPRYSAEDLLSLVNPDIRKPFDMKEVLLRIVDDSRLSIFKPSFGKNLCTAWAKIMGKTSVQLWPYLSKKTNTFFLFHNRLQSRHHSQPNPRDQCPRSNQRRAIHPPMQPPVSPPLLPVLHRHFFNTPFTEIHPSYSSTT
jgi:hypothetical protein